jgi:membrane protease YdiL (CAAX protease family)
LNLVTFDYALIGILTIVLPLYGLWERHSMKRWASDPRVKAYKLTIVIEIGLTLAVLGHWVAAARDLTELGLGLGTGWRWWLGVVLAFASCTFLIIQTVFLPSDPEKLANVRRQYGRLRDLVPRDDREEYWWVTLSMVVGFCEELLYRGYLIVVFMVFLNPWLAVALSSLAFSLIHIYQGKAGVAKTGIIGLMLAGLFLLSGSVWTAVFVHIVMDITSGFIGRRAFYLFDPSASHSLKGAGCKNDDRFEDIIDLQE